VPNGIALTGVPQDVSSGPGWAWNPGGTDGPGLYVTSCGVTLQGFDVTSGGVYLRTGNGTKSASTPCLTIKDTRIRGYVDDSDACSRSLCGPVLMTDDEVDTSHMTINRANVLYDNFYEWRVNNHGGNGSDDCGSNCEIHDSWEHGLVVQGAFHMNGIGSNGTGAGNKLSAIHDYIDCGDIASVMRPQPGAGCSGDLSMFPDFATVTLDAEYNYLAPAISTVNGNYEPGACLYPGQGTSKPYGTINDYVAHNVFGRGYTGHCGTVEPVFGWDNTGKDSGNVWGPGNMWDDGTSLNERG
jgi:hypothetical protein